MFRTQVATTLPGATYYVRAAVQDPDWSAWTGDYHLDVDFAQPLAVRDTVATGTVSGTSHNALGLDVSESRIFSFSPSATSTNLSALNWVDVRIYDKNGTPVALFGTDGKASVDTQSVFLEKGKYTIAVVPTYSLAGTTATATYQLCAALLSDPIDVYDPNAPPIVVAPTPTPGAGFYVPWPGPVG